MLNSTLHSRSSEAKFIIITWLLYIVIASYTIIHHEPWRDEWQAWLIVKDSPNLSSLLGKLQYEGHPALWYLLIWILQTITNEVAAMQLLHLCVAATTAFLCLKYAPFSKCQRALFIFGYFPLYEYAAISRSYGLGFLLLVVFLILYRRNSNSYILHSIVLSAMMQTNLFACILACSIGLAFIIKNISNWKQLLIPSLILITGAILCLAVVFPPPDQQFGGWKQSLVWNDVLRTISSIGNVFIPIPKPTVHFWNSNAITNVITSFIVSILIFILLIFLFLKKRWVLLIFLLTAISTLSFMYLRSLGYLRHSGHLYLMVFACTWLLLSTRSTTLKKPANILLTVFLIIQVGAAAIACYYDWQKPFTAAKETAAYIYQKKLHTLPLAGEPDFTLLSVAGYLDKPVYHLRSGEERTYSIWNNKRVRNLSEQEILQRARDYAQHERQDILVLLSYRLQPAYGDIELLHQFPESIVQDETFFLYRLSAKQFEK